MGGPVTDGVFSHAEIARGISFFWLTKSKWKTLSIDIFFKVPTRRNWVTRLALVPRLATRGTSRLPTMRHISRQLEDMYGASLRADTSKIGPVQILRFGVDLPSPAYLHPQAVTTAGNNLTLERALSFAWEVATSPVLDEGAYPRAMFELEREEHRHDIMSIVNNRPRYASVRLIEVLSQGDPRGLPSWGVLSDLDFIGPRDTWETWRAATSTCPISIYAVGERAEEIGEALSKSSLEFPDGRKDVLDIVAETDPPNPPSALLRAEDRLPGEQTALCVALHTGITEKDPMLPAFLMFDGILGGFPHSKLFRIVREKEGLAYFADTSPNTWRGLDVAIAGIDDKNAGRVEELILEQVEAIRRGEITDEEMTSTRTSLIRRFRSESDSQEMLTRRYLAHEILGGPVLEEELVGGVTRVTKEDVMAVAERAKVVAVYALRAETGGEPR